MFHDWVNACPLVFASNNAPALNDLLGTITLAILAGQHRYSHVSALRADTVNPAGFGMRKVGREDSVRCAFAGAEPAACARWQTGSLRQTWLPALRLLWIMDLDATVKPLYGHQEGAEIGCNPHKPGRPSHAYHSLFVRACAWCWMWKCVRENNPPRRMAGETSGASGTACPGTVARG